MISLPVGLRGSRHTPISSFIPTASSDHEQNNELVRTSRPGPYTAVYLSVVESPLGRLRAGATGGGVIFLDFLAHPGAAERLERRAERYRYEYRECGNEHTSTLEA